VNSIITLRCCSLFTLTQSLKLQVPLYLKIGYIILDERLTSRLLDLYQATTIVYLNKVGLFNYYS